MPMLKKPWTRERFLSKLDTSGGPDACWPWLGANSGTQGYGHIRKDGRDIKAHRLAFELFNGELTPDQDVRHTCDNPPCCNPSHLVAGSTTDNILDMESKGRSVHLRGSAHGRAKLTEDDVLVIRLRCADTPHVALAAEYGVTNVNIGAICKRKIWKHLP